MSNVGGDGVGEGGGGTLEGTLYTMTLVKSLVEPNFLAGLAPQG